MEICKEKKGITLIALIITIIILLILSGIALSSMLGKEGILKTTVDATILTKIGEIEEQATLEYLNRKSNTLIEEVTIQQIVNDLKTQGYHIVENVTQANKVTGIVLNSNELTMDRNTTINLTYTIQYETGTVQYFVEIQGKYYEITMENEKISVSKKESNLEQTDKEMVPNISINKEGIITAQLGQNDTIIIKSGEVFGQVEIILTYEEKTTTCKVTVEPPPPSAGLPNAKRDITQTIPYDWKELAELAELISGKADIITDDTEEVAVSINGRNDTLRVGDTTTVDGKTVRILGFNHDELSEEYKNIYGEERKYAGISFEYVDFIIDKSGINSKATTINGWGECELRTLLNSTTIEEIGIKNYIKEVKKQYIKVYNDETSETISNDKLWLLSCGEIWKNVANVVSTEGRQYKYYKQIDAIWNIGEDLLKKPSQTKEMGNVSREWWLRSPSSTFLNRCNYVSTYGTGVQNFANCKYNIAPGFSI